MLILIKIDTTTEEITTTETITNPDNKEIKEIEDKDLKTDTFLEPDKELNKKIIEKEVPEEVMSELLKTN